MINIDSLPNESLKQMLQHPDLRQSDIYWSRREDLSEMGQYLWWYFEEEKGGGEEAAEISDSWKNTFRNRHNDENYPYRDEDSRNRKLVVEYNPPLS